MLFIASAAVKEEDSSITGDEESDTSSTEAPEKDEGKEESNAQASSQATSKASGNETKITIAPSADEKLEKESFEDNSMQYTILLTK